MQRATAPVVHPAGWALISVQLRSYVDIRTWLATAHVCIDPWVGLLAWCVLFVLAALGVGLLPLALLGLFILAGALWLTRAAARLERLRLSAFLGVADLAPVAEQWSGGLWSRTVQQVRSAAAWRELAYLMVLLVTGVVGSAIIVTTWSVGVALAPWPLYGWALPDGNLLPFHGWQYTLVGLAALVAAPWVARGWAELDVRIARLLLAVDDRVVLEQQVETLELRRGAAVDAADAERRRIERDLHDGAQQRLVSLAMNLGRARAKMAQGTDSDPSAVSELVAAAHEDAKAALSELRDLARGIHPSVLTDRGLDAALSAVAARSPVPVTVHYAVAERPDRTTEAIAYFVVTEALTNVAKHSAARRAEIRVDRAPGARSLRVEVMDDGTGGARTSSGSGLIGLQNRVSTVGGHMHLSSPVGGPTRLVVELPCAS